MWSDRYNYYNIQSDENFSQKINTETVVHILLESNYLKQKNHHSFENRENFPWVEIMLTETKDGNFSSSDKKNDLVNLVAIVCSKEQDIDQQIYLDAFLEIANNLNWKLFLEEDDEGNKNIEIS